MFSGEVRIKLIRSKDEGKLFAAESQADLQKFYDQIRAGGVEVNPGARTMDGVSGGGGLVGEFVLGSAQAVGPAIGAAMDAWFRGRAGRKLSLKVDDINIEARSVVELQIMLLRAIALKDGNGSPIDPETKT